MYLNNTIVTKVMYGSDLNLIFLIYLRCCSPYYYESRRRLFSDSQPERVEKARVTQQNSKKKVLRKEVFKSKVEVFNLCCMWLLISFQTALQLYDRRKKVLKKDREQGKCS